MKQQDFCSVLGVRFQVVNLRFLPNWQIVWERFFLEHSKYGLPATTKETKMDTKEHISVTGTLGFKLTVVNACSYLTGVCLISVPYCFAGVYF